MGTISITQSKAVFVGKAFALCKPRYVCPWKVITSKLLLLHCSRSQARRQRGDQGGMHASQTHWGEGGRKVWSWLSKFWILLIVTPQLEKPTYGAGQVNECRMSSQGRISQKEVPKSIAHQDKARYLRLLQSQKIPWGITMSVHLVIHLTWNQYINVYIVISR